MATRPPTKNEKLFVKSFVPLVLRGPYNVDRYGLGLCPASALSSMMWMGRGKVVDLINSKHVGKPPAKQTANNSTTNQTPRSKFNSCPGAQKKGAKRGYIVLGLDEVEKDRPWLILWADKLADGTYEIIGIPGVTHLGDLLDPKKGHLWRMMHVVWAPKNRMTTEEQQAFKADFSEHNDYNRGVLVDVEEKFPDSHDYYLFMPFEAKSLKVDKIGKVIGSISSKDDLHYMKHLRMAIIDAIMIMIEFDLDIDDFNKFLKGWEMQMPDWALLEPQKSHNRLPPPTAAYGDEAFDLNIVVAMILKQAGERDTPSMYKRIETTRMVEEQGYIGDVDVPKHVLKHQSRYDPVSVRQATVGASRVLGSNEESWCDEAYDSSHEDETSKKDAPRRLPSPAHSPSESDGAKKINQTASVEITPGNPTTNVADASQHTHITIVNETINIAPQSAVAPSSTFNISNRLGDFNVNSIIVAPPAPSTAPDRARSRFKNPGRSTGANRAPRSEKDILNRVAGDDTRVTKPKRKSEEAPSMRRQEIHDDNDKFKDMS